MVKAEKAGTAISRTVSGGNVKVKYLPPMILKESIYEPIEEAINRIFEVGIFGPLREALRAVGFEIENARAPGLERALAGGVVYYDDGRIYGKFNASLSKELRGMGATFDKRTSSWKLPASAALPARLQLAIAEANARADKAIHAVLHTLSDLDLPQLIDKSALPEQYEKAAWRLNEEFIKATKEVAIAPEFTPAAREIIAKEWAQNLELYIKDWSDTAILELREKVEANTMRGQRSGNLVKMIKETYGASQAKAKFLARQETSLLMSKMRETRYKDLGIERYKWQGMMDERERPDHKVLNGQIFTWSQPPITNRQTGARNNPGEDFGCRCLAIPILEG